MVKLRQALGEAHNEHRYIETIQRRGYRFVACVTEASQQRSSQERDRLAVAPSSVTVPTDGDAGASSATIAVLPFKSIGPTGGEYLGLGMADALITRLSNLRRVTVRPTALAYTGVAGCYIVLGSYTALASQQSYPKAERAILRALELDGELAEAHASLGHLRTRQWDWSGAESELKRAIELNPNYAIGHAWYAIYLSEIGQFDEAFAEIKRAQTLDPVSLIIKSTEGSLFYLARRYDQAIEQFRRTLELDAGFALAHPLLGLAYEAKENYQEAVTEYQWALSVLGNLRELLACLGRIHALAGRTDEALEAIDELRCLSAERPVCSPL
jgi:Flp pilus assembly protein TadD